MELIELMLVVTGVLDELSIPYFVTGSCASISYGESRLTNDIDIVANLQPKHVASLLQRFPIPEFYISEDAIEEAIARHQQFNIIHPTSGLKVDVIIMKPSEFGDQQFARCKRIPLMKGKSAAFASPEDVILSKMTFYKEGGSEKHLRDITGMLKLSGEMIDRNYISAWTKRLGVEEIWATMLKRTDE